MAGDQEMVTAAAAVAAGSDLVPRASAQPTAIAAELLARTRAELPRPGGRDQRGFVAGIMLWAAAWDPGEDDGL